MFNFAQEIPWSRSRRLVVLELENLLCYVQRHSSEQRTGVGIHIGNISVLPRPGLHDLLKSCYDNYDVAIWSALDCNLVSEILSKMLTDVEMSHVKYAWTQAHCRDFGYLNKSNKSVLLKSIETVAAKIKHYRPENIIQIDSCPSRASTNMICASLFPPKYYGSLEDCFFRKYLIPHLEKLANSGHCLVFANKTGYPLWSVTSLQRDWVENFDIWENLYLRRYADELLIQYFERRRTDLKSKYRKLT